MCVCERERVCVGERVRERERECVCGRPDSGLDSKVQVLKIFFKVFTLRS